MQESADELSRIDVTLSGRTINNLHYADDIVLITTSPGTLQELADKVDAVSTTYQYPLPTLVKPN